MLSTVNFLHRTLSFPGIQAPTVHIPFLKQDLALLRQELKMQMYATGVNLSFSQITPSTLMAVLDIIQEINADRTPYSNTYQTITFLNLAGNHVTFAKMSDEQYRMLAHKLINSGITSLELDGCSSTSDNDDVVEGPSSDDDDAIEGPSSDDDDVIEKLHKHIVAVIENPLEVRYESVSAPAALPAGVNQNGAEEIDEKDVKDEFNLKLINGPIILTAAGRASVRISANVGYKQKSQLIDQLDQHYLSDCVYFDLPDMHFDHQHEQARFLLNNLYKKLLILKDINSSMPELRLHVTDDIACDATGYTNAALGLNGAKKNGTAPSEDNEEYRKKVVEEGVNFVLDGVEKRKLDGRDQRESTPKEQSNRRPETYGEDRTHAAGLRRRNRARRNSRPNIIETVNEVGTSASKEIGQNRLELQGEIDSTFTEDRLRAAISNLNEIARQLIISHAEVGNQMSDISDRSIQSIVKSLEKHIMTYRAMYLLWDGLFVYCNDRLGVTEQNTAQDLAASNYTRTTPDEKDVKYYYQISSNYTRNIALIGQQMNSYYNRDTHYSIISDEKLPLNVKVFVGSFRDCIQHLYSSIEDKNKQDIQKYIKAICNFIKNICEELNRNETFFGGCRKESSKIKTTIMNLFFTISIAEKIDRQVQDFIFNLQHIIQQLLQDIPENEPLSSLLNPVKKALDEEQIKWLNLRRNFFNQACKSCNKSLSLVHKELQLMNCISQILLSSKKAVTKALEVESTKDTKKVKPAASTPSGGYMPQPPMRF
jgi:hypothetical protein